MTTARRKPEYSEKQALAIGYCIDRGREIEREMKKLQDEQNGKILDYETQKKIREKEKELTKEAAALKADYREAREAKKKYDYYVEQALRLKDKWGFK